MKRIQLEITAKSALAIGRKKPGGSISEVENYIPGAVIRGAVAGLMIRQANAEGSNFADDPDSDFKAIFIDGGAIFQNAYPAIAEVNKNFKIHSNVQTLPATALSAKNKPGFRPSGNGTFDSLIDRFCADQFQQIYDPNCPVDGERVDPYKGFYSYLTQNKKQHYYPHSTSTRLLTRVGINRRRSTAEDQILYSTQVLEEFKRPKEFKDPKEFKNQEESNRQNIPMVFCGSILVEDSLAEDLYNYLVCNATNIRLGSSTSRGLGRVVLKCSLVDEKSTVGDRITTFNTALENRWNLWKLFDASRSSPTEKKLFFTIGLQSDAILNERWQRTMVLSEAILKEAVGNLPGNLKLESAYSSHDYRSGWNNAWGLMKDIELVTDRGSVYCFSIEQEHQDVWKKALVNLENSGVGDRISEGFGQVKVCSEFHCVFRENAV